MVRRVISTIMVFLLSVIKGGAWLGLHLLLDIAERVGHEAISITYKYAHMYPNKQDEMARKLEEERS